VHGFEIARGRDMTAQEVEHRANVVVLGPTTREALFGNRSPFGQTVRLNGIPFTVIGEYAPKGKLLGNDLDNSAGLPYTTMDKYFAAPMDAPPWVPRRGELFLHAIAVTPEMNEEAQKQIIDILRVRRHLPSNKPNKKGAFYMRDGLLRNGVGGLGAASVGLMEDSSGIMGFWTDTSSTVLSAKPAWLNRLVFFDLKGDTVNAKTNKFIKDLQGDFIGTSVCPERIINFANYSIDSVSSMVKAIKVPSTDDFDEPPLRVLGLICENDAYPALDMAAMNRSEYDPFVRVIPIRCLGSVNTIWITDALNSGYDGVMMMGCKKGDDYQCHFVKGSELAHYRMSKIGDTLKQLGLEPERVVTQEVAITDNVRVVKLINDYVAELEKLGPSPMKGFG